MGQRLSLEDFSKIANSMLESDFHSGFFSLQSALRSLVYDSGEIASIANNELKTIAKNPAYDSEFWEPHHLILGGGVLWQLRVGLYSRSSEFIYTTPQHMMIAVLGNQSLNADHYKFPKSFDIDVFSQGIELTGSVRYSHAPGSIVSIDSRSDIVDVDIESPVLVVKFTSMVNHALQWAFRRDTRQAIQAIAANPIDSELVSMVRTLGAMAHPDAVPSLLELVHHPCYFVRWTAMQALGRISAERVLPYLHRAAAEDPHPHVRNAAARTISRNLAKE